MRHIGISTTRTATFQPSPEPTTAFTRHMPHSFARSFMLGFCGLPSNLNLNTSSAFLGCKRPELRDWCRTGEVETSWARTGRVIIHCSRRGGSRGGGTFRPRGDGRRPNRVAELIRREMSGIIDSEYSRAFSWDEASSSVLVSIVDVKCSDDLRHARVSVSVLGTEDQKKRALDWLKGAKRELRFKLAQCVTLKYIPQLSFTESELAQALKTMTILDQLAKEREMKSVGSGATTGVTAYAGEQEVGKDDLILDDLDMDGIFDIADDGDDDDDDDMFVEVGDGGEDLAAMSDSDVKRALYKVLGDDELARR